MKKDCAFQYYNGLTVVIDKTNLTIEEAKSLFNENYEDMASRTKNNYEIEAAIWINMSNDSDYKETIVHLCIPSVDEFGTLWERRNFDKF